MHVFLCPCAFYQRLYVGMSQCLSFENLATVGLERLLLSEEHRAAFAEDLGLSFPYSHAGSQLPGNSCCRRI